MSLLLVPFFSVTLARASSCRWIQTASGTRQSSAPTGVGNGSHNKGGLVGRMGLAFLVGRGVLLVGIGAGSLSNHGVQNRTSDRTGGIPVDSSRECSQELKAALAEPTFAADLVTLQMYQRALTTELATTNQALVNRPRDVTLLKRRQLLNSVLSNSGGTGVNDRLAATESVKRLLTEPETCTQENVSAAYRAVTDLRDSVNSWKTGPFSSAARFLGISWQESKGLTVSQPYIWGKHGWEADVPSRNTGETPP